MSLKGTKRGGLSLVNRATGAMRSFTFDKFRADEIHPIVRANIAREARLMTDEARTSAKLGKEFAEHGTTSRHQAVRPPG